MMQVKEVGWTVSHDINQRSAVAYPSPARDEDKISPHALQRRGLQRLMGMLSLVLLLMIIVIFTQAKAAAPWMDPADPFIHSASATLNIKTTINSPTCDINVGNKNGNEGVQVAMNAITATAFYASTATAPDGKNATPFFMKITCSGAAFDYAYMDFDGTIVSGTNAFLGAWDTGATTEDPGPGLVLSWDANVSSQIVPNKPYLLVGSPTDVFTKGIYNGQSADTGHKQPLLDSGASRNVTLNLWATPVNIAPAKSGIYNYRAGKYTDYIIISLRYK